MSKSILYVAIITLFLVSGALLLLALKEGILYSELLAKELEDMEACQNYLCMGGRILFLEKHLSNLIIYSSGAAAAFGGGIVLLVKRDKWLANNSLIE